MMPQVQEDDMGHGGCEAPEATAPENLLTMNSFEKKKGFIIFLVVFFFRYLTSYLCFYASTLGILTVTVVCSQKSPKTKFFRGYLHIIRHPRK